MDDFLTTTEVAAWLRVPESTLRQWRYENKGPRSFKLGALVRYQRADVEAWLTAQYEQTSAGAAAPRQIRGIA